MKKLKKIMTVALSLVLCASLVAPSFAASFFDLQDAIDTGVSKYKEGYTEDSAVADEDKYAIKASKDETGRTNVTLYENIVASEATRLSGFNLERKDDQVVINQTNVTLDLNGHSLIGDGKDRPIQIINHELTLEDSAGGGKITGGAAPVNEYSDGLGGAVLVAGAKGKFIMNGGEISGNSAVYGGGVALLTGSSFTMNGGTISGNEAQYGGAIYGGSPSSTGQGTSTTVNGGTISGNTASVNGGGIYSREGSNTTVTGGSISENTASTNGGGIYNSKGSNTTVTGGSISGNTANSYAGGVYNNGTFTMEGGKISGNTAEKGADDIWNVTGGTITLPDAGGMGADLDGKAVTGWYNDYSGRWGDTYDNMGSIQGYTGQLLVKAAHDVYFTVTDDDGNVLTEVETGTELDVSELAPGEREGYEFLGWTDENGEIVTTVTVDKAITLVAKWEKIEQPTTPDAPIVTPNEPDNSGASDVEIDAPAVPLASGPITRAQFIDYLWRHEGKPESVPATFADVSEDHQYAPAIGWAQSIGLISGDTFEPDELVTVAAARDFLSKFALYGDMVMPELAALVGDEDEAVLNCGEVLAEFFGEELAE